MFGMMLTGDGIPVLGEVLDGNRRRFGREATRDGRDVRHHSHAQYRSWKLTGLD
jgi:hypothetical protein